MNEELIVTTRTRSRRIDTSGLEQEGMSELSATYAHERQVEQAQDLMDYLLSYLETGARFLDGETLSYGSWAIKFVLDDPVEGFLNIWEYDEPNDRYVPVLNFCLDLWLYQQEVCEDFDSDFCPPRTHELVAITDLSGGLEPPDVYAYRDTPDSSGSKSGWWISSSEYGWDAKSSDFRHLHLVHLASNDDSLLSYLALEPGFFFIRKDGATSVGYDPALLD